MRKRLIASILIFTFLSLVLYSYHEYPPFSWLGDGVQKLFSGPKASLYAWRSKILNRDSGSTLKLKEENRKVAEKIVDYESLKKDNEALRGQFDSSIPEIALNTLLPADVVGAAGRFDSPYRLVINKGKKNGVKKGMSVVSGRNLVGKIGEVSTFYSHVILPVADAFSTVGKTAANNTMGIVKGKNDFILFDQVVIADTLQDGEIVTTKGELDNHGLGILPGLIVGKISSINKVETKPFQSAKITPLVEYYKLNKVFVVLPQK